MPGQGEEEVVLKFGEQGAKNLAATLESLRQAVVNIQAAFNDASATTDKVTKNTEVIKQKHENLNREFRVGASVTSRLAAGMAGELSPALGKVASGIGQAVQAAILFGGPIGIAIASIQFLVSTLMEWNEQSKQAEEFQLRLTRAVKQGDFGFISSQLEEATLQSQKYGEMTDELRKKLEDLRIAARLVFRTEEGPKLQREVLTEQLNLAKQAVEQEAGRAQTIDQVSEALTRQMRITRELAELRAQSEEKSVEQRVKQLRADGLSDEASQVEAAARAKADVIRATAQLETDAQVKAARDREIAITQQTLQLQQQRLQAVSAARIASIEDQKKLDLAALEDSNRTTAQMAQDRMRIETDAAQRIRDEKIAAIEAESQALRERAMRYEGNLDVQREVEGQLIQLQQQRISAEREADNSILEQRRQMVQQMQALAQQEAQIGQSLASAEIADLQRRGKARVSLQDIVSGAQDRQRRAAETLRDLQLGGRVKVSALQEAMGAAGTFGQLTDIGGTVSGTIQQMLRQQLGGLTGRRERFDPMTMLGPTPSMVGAITQPREGLPAGIDETARKRVDEALDQFKNGADKAIGTAIERIPPLMEGLFDRFVDDLLRKIETEAARS